MRNDIKGKLDAAKTEEEIMAIIEKNGLTVLSDEDLDRVAGGRPNCSPGCPPIENGCSC